ncbi:uncharacterized protein LOC121622339 isoform X2 [Chelmon rostratus]|uniref:uncharacterized protein LOC121622339 isoform X2 n=1 Tax=Chelmon rostratus TaxID=109905 RepID=UPI001BECBC28|nr:uncharacterized protein LOC121622339 isoform X2 [Chelmon rostratus]
MAEFRWINVSLFLILVLHFTAAAGQYSPHFVVRDGDEVTLPCGHMIDDQSRCGSIDWLLSGPGRSTVQLVKNGQIGENIKPDRLSVTENCSLVIKKVTGEDVGFYTCRRIIPRHQYEDANVHLLVITMTERTDSEEVTLFITVLTHRQCEYRVKWLHEDQNVEKDKDMETYPSCSATVKFPTTYLKQDLRYPDLFKFEVTNHYTGQVQQFDFSPQPSGEDATTATTTSAIITPKNRNEGRTDSSGPAITTTPESWWLYIVVPTGVAALLVVIVTVIIWKRTKGKTTQMDESTGLSSNPAVTESGPETNQDRADPEDGVSYASVSYTKRTSSKGQVKDDEGDAVTYSTVKASSSCAGASDDPCTLYATVNKPNK